MSRDIFVAPGLPRPQRLGHSAPGTRTGQSKTDDGRGATRWPVEACGCPARPKRRVGRGVRETRRGEGRPAGGCAEGRGTEGLLRDRRRCLPRAGGPGDAGRVARRDAAVARIVELRLSLEREGQPDRGAILGVAAVRPRVVCSRAQDRRPDKGDGESPNPGYHPRRRQVTAPSIDPSGKRAQQRERLIRLDGRGSRMSSSATWPHGAALGFGAGNLLD
jgi:hypothetical protein